MRHRALVEEAQASASDPAISAFVAASAGSGKTKLLTDRLLRLMLNGADPARIQCLTFTRAAAAEMAIRLQTVLGRWVSLDDAPLDTELDRLGVPEQATRRERARALFARVLDLPGGMRIGTIHAFCQSLLRRFPLEAQLSPHFRLIEDRDAEEALGAARERMLAHATGAAQQAALALLAGLTTLDGFGRLVSALRADRERLDRALSLPDLAAAQRRVLGLGLQDRARIIADAVRWPGEAALTVALRQVLEEGASDCAGKAASLLDWLGRAEAERARHWKDWRAAFLTAAGEPRQGGGFVNPSLAKRARGLASLFRAEAERVAFVEDAAHALDVADASAALVTLAAPVLGTYASSKDESGLLDYDDLITATSALLVDPGAAWVLYKLDGGLDHLLLDEVQDTSPAQWRIAHALVGEFFAGLGARPGGRTIFAVGDRKQSIYSFQGAETDAFDRSRALLGQRVRGAGAPWADVRLDVSFRSTAPVLALTDAVFANPEAACGVCEPGVGLSHVADRAGQAGSVELWPLAPRTTAPPLPPWHVPDDYLNQPSAPARLAERLASWIEGQVSGAVLLESRARPLAPGDVLVLLRRRGPFATALVRALKGRGVAVAGLDRLVLTDQPAVQDLLALCDALLLPSDDLALATVLTSPLGGLSDEDLMCLAVGRQGSLWDELSRRADQHPHWQRARDFLSVLLSRTDYVSPHALLAEALGPLSGRARLFARLGPEAAEPIDELLAASLAYADTHPPSLQGFVHWLRQSGAEVKREAEGAGGSVRVMTVHGAKGLQAPLVILPDTTLLPPDKRRLLWHRDPASGVAVPLWTPRAAIASRRTKEIRTRLRRAELEEENRLLYVALTRAEDRLVVCGWEPPRGLPETCWYSLVRAGFARLDAAARTDALTEAWGETLGLATPQRDPPRETGRRETASPAPLPDWAGQAPDWRPTPPPPEPPRPVPLAPSRPEGIAFGPAPPAASPLASRASRERRFQRGNLIHALLQHLPDLPEGAREDAARGFLARPGQGIDAASVAEIVAETQAILAHPDLKALFGPAGRAEVPLTGRIGDAVVGGLVDRIAVTAETVLLADFKTNRDPPRRVADTPLLYLTQMAAYRAIVREIFPGRDTRCALVWTRTAQVEILPSALLDRYQPPA